MSPEPLKGKRLGYGVENLTGESIWKESDIRSAVEWLIGELERREPFHNARWIYPLINKAFEDVMK